MIVKAGKEEDMNETVTAGRIQRIDKCKYLRITISTDGQLTEHIKELNTRCEIINREICGIKLNLFEMCLMLALLYGMEASKRLSKAEIQHLQKIP